MAEHVPSTPTRRAMLALAGSTVLAGAVVAAPALASANPDAALVRLVDEALEADRQSWTMAGDLVGPYPPAVQAEEDRLRVLWRERVQQAIDTPATTLEGYRAKARLLRDLLPKDAAGNLWRPENAEWEELVGWSLASDLIASA